MVSAPHINNQPRRRAAAPSWLAMLALLLGPSLRAVPVPLDNPPASLLLRPGSTTNVGFSVPANADVAFDPPSLPGVDVNLTLLPSGMVDLTVNAKADIVSTNYEITFASRDGTAASVKV